MFGVQIVLNVIVIENVYLPPCNLINKRKSEHFVNEIIKNI